MYANVNDIKIFYETFGNRENNPILLIMGAGSQGILWTDDFCNELANHGFYVIRYDHRDTGLSTCINYEEHPYSLKELAQDALGLLDSLNIPKANVIGLSMGGHLVQLIAIHHPERLITATLMMTTPNHMVFMNALAGKDTPSSDLPKPNNEALRFFSTQPSDLNNRDKVINHSLESWKLLNGKKANFDEAYWRALITKHYDRIQNHIAQYNHGSACLGCPDDRTMALKNVKVPTLIIHGAEDPMLPIEHGKALSSAIPNSKLLIIENMGHALNPIFQHEIIQAIIDHINFNSGFS